jgi:crotonobetaine/carnitine-CoA ligase
MRLGPEDRYLTCLPLFHGMAQLSGTMAPLLAGAAIVLERRFSVSRFWDVCRTHGVTGFGSIAAMTSMLQSAPESDADREHDVRFAFAVAVPAPVHVAFEARFGVRLVNGYGLTEASMLTYCPYDDRRPGSSGVPVPQFEVELHGADGHAVEVREVGEIVCRPRTHGALMLGYHRRPEATLAAWRDLWFHTGDLARADEDGFLYFVDRDKDAIRRRGENISSFEVEAEVALHPGVAEVAAYPVPSELGEDEVMIAVVAADASLTPEDLHGFCRDVLPRFAVPRYVRFMDALPHTPTAKVRKVSLREEGVAPGTWVAP